MRDLHVARLRYRLVPDEAISFDRPPPVERQTEAFHMRLADEVATFDMVEHHASEESARQSVEPFLRAWELDAALRSGRPEIGFVFQDSEIVDRDPPPPGTGQVIYAKAAMAAAAALTATAHVTRGRYPEPPQAFIVSPDVETMWHRYVGYLEGRERLADMAYACLTVLEGSAGSRDKAAGTYRISNSVLGTLGRLTTEIGDGETARKFNRLKERRPHTAAERAWIEAAVKALIRRAGEWVASPEVSRPQLTMNDLPKLASS
jgi:hypothetical protein